MEIDIVRNFFIKILEEKVEGVKREIKIERIKNKVISIIGPRRVGKTWLLLKIFSQEKESSVYIDFSHPAFKDITINEMYDLLKIYSEITGKDVKRILLDEVQNLNNWEYVIRGFLSEGYEIYVTGSSSKLLSKEIATHLRGRTIPHLLLGFSFREFLNAKKFEIKNFYTFEEIGKILKLLREYLFLGSYPEIILNPDKKEILWKTYFNEIFYNDFVERHKIKSLELGRLLIEFAFQNFSNEISINKIANSFKSKIKFSPRTLYEYIEKLEDTLNIFFLKRYSEKVYERLNWPRKIYVCDLGLSNILGISENYGKRMENIVFLELLRKTNEKPLMEIYYFKDYQQREVDFVIKEGLSIKQLIQVTYASNKDEIDKREIRSLLKASELLKCKDLLIITWDYEDEMKINNKTIKFIPLWKWLLKI